MAHDIYSVGVVLLEIGLWRSFVIWNGFNNFMIDETVLKGGNAMLRRMKERQPRAEEECKKLLEGVAAQELPNVMGERLCEVVLKFLGAVEGGLVKAIPRSGKIDTTGTKNGGQMEEKIGLGYIQGVLESFESIKI
jgi:hypothetical protein